MSAKKKFLITFCALALICAVVVAGVFAFSTQEFSISNKITFTATGHVSATVQVEANYYSGDTKGAAIDLDPESANDYILYDIEANALTGDKSLPDIAFTGSTNDLTSADQVYDIVYTFTITNTGTAENGCDPFQIGFSVTDSNSTTLPSCVTRTVIPNESTSQTQTAIGGINAGDITGDPAFLPITGTNTTTITVRYSLTSIEENLDFSQSFNFLFIAEDPAQS